MNFCQSHLDTLYIGHRQRMNIHNNTQNIQYVQNAQVKCEARVAGQYPNPNSTNPDSTLTLTLTYRFGETRCRPEALLLRTNAPAPFTDGRLSSQ